WSFLSPFLWRLCGPAFGFATGHDPGRPDASCESFHFGDCRVTRRLAAVVRSLLLRRRSSPDLLIIPLRRSAEAAVPEAATLNSPRLASHAVVLLKRPFAHNVRMIICDTGALSCGDVSDD